MTPAEWDALEAARTNWYDVVLADYPVKAAIDSARLRLTKMLLTHLDELVAGVRPKCPGCEGDGTQMYQRGWVQKPCHECGGSGFASDCDGSGLAP